MPTQAVGRTREKTSLADFYAPTPELQTVPNTLVESDGMVLYFP